MTPTDHLTTLQNLLDSKPYMSPKEREAIRWALERLRGESDLSGQDTKSLREVVQELRAIKGDWTEDAWNELREIRHGNESS